MRTQEEVWTAILASSRMPWAGGPPVEIDGRRYLDGGMISPVPVAEAIAAGATHVLALQTRPFGIPRKSASRVGDRLIERHLRGLNPALVTVYRERIGHYETARRRPRAALAATTLGPPQPCVRRRDLGHPGATAASRRGRARRPSGLSRASVALPGPR